MIRYGAAVPMQASTSYTRPSLGLAVVSRQRRCLPRLVAAAAGSSQKSSDNVSDFGTRAQQFAESTQEQVKEFVRQQKLDEKAAAASSAAQEKLKGFYEESQENLRRTYMEMDSTYNIRENLGKTARRVSEAAQDLDQQLSFRRRLRNAADDFGRKAPVWRRQFGEFSSTSGGKATLLVVFLALLMSGTLWQLVNLLWLLWWVSLPVGLFVADRNRREMQEQQARQQQEEASSRTWWGASSSGSSSYGRGGSSVSKRYSQGPVVEAQWVSLDEEEGPKKK